MKKLVFIIVSVAVIIGLYFLVAHIKNEISWKKWQTEQEERKHQNKLALDERYKKYFTLYEINNKYSRLEDNMTTEDIKDKIPKQKFIDDILGSTMYLYVRLYDIKQEGDHRVIKLSDESHWSSSIHGIKYIFYDDKKVITDVNVKDKMDIVAVVENCYFKNESNGLINKEILYIQFKVIELERKYGDFSPSMNSHLDQRNL